MSRLSACTLLGLLCLSPVASAQEGSASEEPAKWPAAQYGIFVGTGYDAHTETGVGYGIETNGHANLVKNVEKKILESGRKPDFLFLHCLGVYLNKNMELIGWEVARDGGHGLEAHPPIVNTLHLWGEMLDRHGMTGVLYVGGVANPMTEKYRQEDPQKWRAMVDWTLGLTIGAGFDWICSDASSRYQVKGKNAKFGPDHPGLAYFTQQAQARGLGVMVEAWPHKDLEPLYAGLPVVMLYRGAFLPQHPEVSVHKWGQAPAATHAGVVLFDSRDTDKLDDKSIGRVLSSGSVAAISWDEWSDFAPKMPARVPGIRMGGAR